ncbi:MAG: MarR family transcriptional regulator [Actinomycetota bacterium]
MPRLDAERILLWRQYCTWSASLQRRVDQQLMDDHDLPLAWYDCLTAIRDAGGELRVHELCEALGDVPSSLSRRLDRLEDEGLVRRTQPTRHDDRRAVLVSLTAAGRTLWRESNITYRRMVQQLFAQRLTDTDIAALQRVFSKFA